MKNEMNHEQQELKLTYSSLYKVKGKSCSSVSFEQGDRVAEGIIPEGVITKNTGFSEEEKKQLEEYLKANADALMKKAKEISGLPHLLS